MQQKQLAKKYRTPGDYSGWFLVQDETGGAYLRESDLHAVTMPGLRKLPVPSVEMASVPDAVREVWRRELRIEPTGPGRSWRVRARATVHRFFHGLPIGPRWATERYCLRCQRYYRMPAGIPNSTLK